MRHLRFCAAILGLASAAVSAQAKIEYFAPGTFRRNRSYDSFVREWYGTTLAAAQEPSLFAKKRSPGVQAYRFLLLQSFHDSFLVRLEVRPDGSSSLIEKTIGRRGSAGAGRVVHEERKEVSSVRTADFLNDVSGVSFWVLPTEGGSVGDDGAEWVIEGVQSGRYHVVNRWSPGKGPAYELGSKLLLDLAGMKLAQGEMD